MEDDEIPFKGHTVMRDKVYYYESFSGYITENDTLNQKKEKIYGYGDLPYDRY